MLDLRRFIQTQNKSGGMTRTKRLSQYHRDCDTVRWMHYSQWRSDDWHPDDPDFECPICGASIDPVKLTPTGLVFRG